jgi:hypothetical protein
MITRGRHLHVCMGCAAFLVAAGCGGSDFEFTSGAGGASGSSSSSSSASSSSSSSSSGEGGAGGAAPLEKFSFFVTSLKAMQDLSKNQLGFGGDLRFGETGPGAGLRGADKICAAVAERSMPGSSVKQWRAYLSVAVGPDGKQVNAIDRIGEGPWYDRLGRLVAAKKADLLHDRPEGADPAIKDDLPNENGIPNMQPDPTKPVEDNHHTATGSTTMGTLFDAKSTCLDWTSAKGDPVTEGRPRMGLTFPRWSGPITSASSNWMSALHETGCAPGVNLQPSPPPGPEDVDIGNGGGYGAIYCFALTP